MDNFNELQQQSCQQLDLIMEWIRGGMLSEEVLRLLVIDVCWRRGILPFPCESIEGNNLKLGVGVKKGGEFK